MRKVTSRPAPLPLVGAHMSIAGGLHLAFERGRKVGCVAIQIFQRPNLQWRAPVLTDRAVELFAAARKATGLDPVVAHACYLINLASDTTATRRMSQAAFVDEMRRVERLGLMGLVMHPGSCVGRKKAIARIVTGINRALATVPGTGAVILETTAGAGKCVGQFEDLAEIIAAVEQPERMGVCLDTCHVFAAGHDIRTAEGYQATLRTFDRIVGIARIRVIHANDSKGELGRHVDRHEHIGRGYIGETAFRLLLRDPRLAHVPKIIEPPKFEKRRSMDRVNLATLRRLAGE